MKTGRAVGACILLFAACVLWAGYAQACPACWAGYGSGDERFNKPLADLRIEYEAKGRDALPYIRDVLKTSTDPLVLKRAANYIVELNDDESIPLFEDMILLLIKRVSFSAFGVDTYDFMGRLAVAEALVKFGPTDLADRIWERYDKLNHLRKDEVPHILNALGDPQLDERLIEIVNREEDHQLVIGALSVLGYGGTERAAPALEAKIEEWSGKSKGTGSNPRPEAPEIYYTPLRVTAEKALTAIQERSSSSQLSSATLCK